MTIEFNQKKKRAKDLKKVAHERTGVPDGEEIPQDLKEVSAMHQSFETMYVNYMYVNNLCQYFISIIYVTIIYVNYINNLCQMFKLPSGAKM